MIVKLEVVGMNGRGVCEIKLGDRLTARPDGRADKTVRRRGWQGRRRWIGTALEPVEAGVTATIAVRLRGPIGARARNAPPNGGLTPA